MTPILYTDTDQIRATVGVTEFDVKDVAIVSSMVGDDLLLDLNSWVPTHATIKSEGEGSTPTADQAKKYLLLKQYSRLFCAAALLKTAVLGVAAQVSDGKNSVKRFDSEERMAALAADIDSRKIAAKQQLQTALGETVDSVYAPPAIAVATTPGFDPVTNT